MSRYQAGYRNGHSSQQSLIAMFENWKKNLVKKGKCGALFVDLSKVFDCLQHDLLLAKLYAYGFDYKSLKLISSFLSKMKCRTKINSSFSEWEHLLIGVPQGSILGSYLFMAESNVANYADDTILYASDKKESDVQRKLTLLRVTVENEPHLRPHLLLSLTLIWYIKWSKASCTSRVSKFISKKKLRIIMKVFMSQFSYCPLVWMCHGRTLNNKINKLHERALKLVYDDRQSTFEELLKINKSVTIHHRNL